MGEQKWPDGHHEKFSAHLPNDAEVNQTMAAIEAIELQCSLMEMLTGIPPGVVTAALCAVIGRALGRTYHDPEERLKAIESCKQNITQVATSYGKQKAN